MNLSTSALIYSLVSNTGAVLRFFLKFLLCDSSTADVLYILPDTLLPFGKNLALLFRIDVFSYDILTSLRLDNFIVGLAYYMYP